MERLLKAAQARKIDRVAAAYAVAGWLLVQAAAILLPTFGTPAWVLRVFIILVLAGFPLALATAWFLAPRPQISSSLAAVTRTDKLLVAILGIVSLISLGEFIFILWHTPTNETATDAASPAEMSIAVLPFVNMSGDPSKEYFSDGISEELLNDLANIPELRVAARTSSFAFKGKNTNIEEIARKLRVRAVLEGSVREQGNRVRITAQLINAADGYHLWSQTFDRDLTDILAVQDEIAGAIATALTHKLLGANNKPANKAGSIDPEAYRFYLQAKSYIHRGNMDDLERAADLLRKVTALEPNYANGYAELGAALRNLVDRYSRTEFLVPAEMACRQAISLDPENIEALSNLTALLLDRWQWKQGLDVFQKAQAANPNSADALHLRSVLAYTFNYPEEDIRAELKASELDPLRPGIKYGLALWYWNNKQYDAAAVAIQQVLQLRQGKFQDLDQQCAIEVGRGHLREARRIAEILSSYFAESPQNSMNCLFYMAIAERDFSYARKLTDAAAADAEVNGGSFVTIGDAYRQIGDLEKAMKWYERAYAVRDTLLLLVPYEKWQTPQPLLSHPPWKALWARQPIGEWEAARVQAGKILGVTN